MVRAVIVPEIVRYAFSFVQHYGCGVWDRGGRRRRRVKSLPYETPLASHHHLSPTTIYQAPRRSPRNLRHLFFCFSIPSSFSLLLSAFAVSFALFRFEIPRLCAASTTGFCFKKASQGSLGRDKWYPSQRGLIGNFTCDYAVTHQPPRLFASREPDNLNWPDRDRSLRWQKDYEVHGSLARDATREPW